MLKLKLQYFGHLNGRDDSLEKTLMLGKIEDRKGRGWQRMSYLDDITDSLDKNLSKVLEMVNYREAWPGCSPFDRKELDMTEELNFNNNILVKIEWFEFLLIIFVLLWHQIYQSCAQSYPTLCSPLDCNPSNSFVHGIFQARILEWVSISSSRGSSGHRN